MSRLKLSDIKTKPPKAYEQGWTEFYKLKFKVNPDVLIPRPETELLVDEAIKLNPQTVMDLGTGSGCIAISIAKNLPEANVIATDISQEALKVARQNALFLKVDKKIIFLQSDLLSFLNSQFGKAKAPDIIIANLPYIPSARLMMLDPMVTEHEPRIALDGGVDGFELYRKLFKQIKDLRLFPKYLIAEIDEEQGELASKEAKRFFPNAKEIEIKKDLAKKDRILKIEF